MKYHIVKCKYCGTEIERASFFQTGSCIKCKTRRNNEYHAKKRAEKKKVVDGDKPIEI